MSLSSRLLIVAMVIAAGHAHADLVPLERAGVVVDVPAKWTYQMFKNGGGMVVRSQNELVRIEFAVSATSVDATWDALIERYATTLPDLGDSKRGRAAAEHMPGYHGQATIELGGNGMRMEVLVVAVPRGTLMVVGWTEAFRTDPYRGKMETEIPLSTRAGYTQVFWGLTATATPAVATPAVATPAVATPAVATPAVATPAVATPAVATAPVATAPVATAPVATVPRRAQRLADQVTLALDRGDAAAFVKLVSKRGLAKTVGSKLTRAIRQAGGVHAYLGLPEVGAWHVAVDDTPDQVLLWRGERAGAALLVLRRDREWWEVTEARPGSATDPAPPAAGAREQLVEDAADAAKNGKWRLALDLAEQSIADQPSPTSRDRLFTIATLAACHLKDTVKSRQYYQAASLPSAAMVRERCIAVAGFDPAVAP